MTFVKQMENVLNEELNISVTENGAIGYRTTGKALLDLNFSVSSLRNASGQVIIQKFMLAFFEEKTVALKWLFYCRDIRGGLGERRIFRVVVNHLAKEYPEIIKDYIVYIAEYGRFDDMFTLRDTSLWGYTLDILKRTFNQDCENCRLGKPITLLGKWLPSINSHSFNTKKLATEICDYFNISKYMYQKALVGLRNHLDVVEVKMSARRWEEINYPSVPSKANLNYKNAFLKHDKYRRQKYLEKVSAGEEKINGEANNPYEIVGRYMRNRGFDETLEQLWKALPNYVNGDSSTIVVADGSRSMGSTIGDTKYTALDIANSLAIYCAERLSGEFKDKYITFSRRPQLVDLSKGNNLREKIDIARRRNEVANTDIEAVFKLILTTAIKFNLTQEEMPKNILILSDMEFDSCGGRDADSRLFDIISKEYENNGYKIPRLVFWNICSRSSTIPVKENENGVALVSGFSASIFELVISSETDPYKLLLNKLNSERYSLIGE